MKKIVSVIIILSIMLSLTTSCSFQKEDDDIIFPIDIQISYYLESSHFYRINSNGSIEYMENMGGCIDLYELEPKGFDYLDFDKKAEVIGQLDNESLVNIINLTNKLIDNEELKENALDAPEVHIYYNNKSYEFCVVGFAFFSAGEKEFYSYLQELFDFLDNNTSVKLNREIY